MVAFTDARITESSCAAVGVKVPTRLYTSNDENTSPHVFAVDLTSGATVAEWNWVDAGDLEDPEAMCIDSQARLWHADIGDNDADRDDCAIYMVAEPDGTGNLGNVNREKYRIAYPDGPRQAESFLIHPVTNQRYIITRASAGSLYELPASLSNSSVNMLTKHGYSLPAEISDACFTGDGRFVLIAQDGAPTTVTVLDSTSWQTVGTIAVPSQADREGIALAADGKSFWITSEGALSTFYNVALPPDYWPNGSGVPTNPCG